MLFDPDDVADLKFVPLDVREVRRDIARLKTIAQSKRSGTAKAGSNKPAAAKPPAAKRAPKRAKTAAKS